MSDNPAVSIKDLSKMYKLYSSRRYRLFDLFNLNFALDKNSYQEFWALRDINLEIPRGGKIGIIGRNGAGKSTLLKIICNNIEPTSGRVQVNGRVSALLELGTGFHPEFSGRENIFASLAYMGVTGGEAAKKFDEIVDFSELEEFIDNPIKTYSAGMYARLAFSVSTAITPEILIIDEVLGAGDAYFAMKCVDKMLALTTGGSTVLFVSHDLASVQRLCDKAIWIDRGRIVMEGDTLSVSKSYGASVREQEEIRLRARNTGLSRQSVRQMKDVETPAMLFHVINGSWTAFKGKHPVRNIILKINGNEIERLRVGDAMDNDVGQKAHILASPGYMEWGAPVLMDGGYVRRIEGLGGKYAHAPFVFSVPVWIEDIKQAVLEVEYKDISDEIIFVEVYDGEKYNRLGGLEGRNDGKWKTAVMDISTALRAEMRGGPEDDDADVGAVAPAAEETQETGPHDGDEKQRKLHSIKGDVYGTGEVTITRVRFLDRNDREKNVFTTGDTLKIRISYNAVAPVTHPVFVAAIYRMDGIVVHQAISSRDGVDFGHIDGEGRVDIEYDPLYIGAGDFIVSAAIFHSVDLFNPNESPAYCLHDRKYHLKIRYPAEYALDLGIVDQPVVWTTNSSPKERLK
ncbi:MAG: ABC transporter ATP-binding protein [Nitrospirae bacterium]|nr:ABC transporter ATP-binding protein [Nitrospirota bacterium]